ncbi:MAG TPA: carbohydrate ABC transporter permease [Candidatus Faecaligallichristensenella faecipullorum]|nr:carbohydrate ABC transporter permease [Candidatus Faecaligallichristensenella faecipullorum]
MKEYTTPARKAFLVFNYLFLTVTSLVCILPFIHLLAMSFSSSSAVAAGRVAFWPVEPTLAAYEFALKGGEFTQALWISIQRVVLGVAVNLVLMIITAYPLSKSKQKLAGRNIYMAFFVITMIINGGLIPTYILVVNLGLLNSIWSLILPGAVPVYNMIILMNFIRGLPEEIEEAALIDGAAPIVCLVRVLLPLLAPSLATVGLFSIVNHWNDWFSGIIYMQDSSRYPLQTYLQTLLRDFEEILRLAQGDYTQIISMMNARTGRAAQLFLGALPILLIYPLLQKHFTTGLVLGSVKG